MSPEEFFKKMKEIAEKNAPLDHMYADDLLCETLKELGYGKGIQVFEEMLRWYD